MITKKIILIFVIGSTVFSAFTFSQKSYYVSNSAGNDLNNGLLPDKAFKTLGRLSTLASEGTFVNGDTIKFKRGDVWEAQYLDFSLGMPMDPGAPIVLTTFGSGPSPVFSGRPDGSPPDSLISKGIIITSPNFIIENLEIKNYSKDGINCNVGKSNDLNVTIDSVFIHNNGSDLYLYNFGIYLEGRNTKLLNSQIINNDNDGVYILGANLEIGFCNFLNNGTGLYGDEIQIARCDNFWVHDNYLSNANGDHGTFITKLEFVDGVFERNYCYGDSWGCAIGGSNAVVRYNYFIDNRGFAIDVRGYNTKVYDNVIVNTKDGIKVSGPRESRDGGITKIYNNTILNVSQVALNFENRLDPDSIRIIYKNNLISGFLKTAVSISGQARILKKSGDYNLFYPDNLPDMFLYFSLPAMTTLKQWNMGTGYDRHSISIDPFLDAFYCLSDSSPAIDSGLNLSNLDGGEYNIDIKGYQRQVASVWDIGACEFSININSLSNSEINSNEFKTYQNYPNPFNPKTIIKFAILTQSHVAITVFDALGQMVQQLIDDVKPAGEFEVEFDATHFASGVYFYIIEYASLDGIGKSREVKKMLSIK